MAKTVVILGAGWAGLPLAHRLLKYTVPKASVKVILVSPNSHFFWNVAATRGVIPGAIPDKSLFPPIADAFKQHSADQFEFVLGKAKSINQSANSVDILTNDGGDRSIPYDQLVIATGSRLSSGLPFKPIGTHDETLSAWHALQKKVGDAKTIVVAGAGATGIEVAGELAAKYGSQKQVTLVINGELPLESTKDILPSVRSTMDKDLQKLGVKLVRKSKVINAQPSEDGTSQTLTLDNGSTIAADAYIPVYGIRVNTEFVPHDFLDSDGNVKLDDKFRVVGTENIWALGDVGNREPKQLTITDGQIIHLASALDATLTGKGSIPTYKPAGKTMIFLSLGQKYATGQIGNWKLFGIMVSWVKGRKLFVDTAESYVGGKSLRHEAM